MLSLPERPPSRGGGGTRALEPSTAWWGGEEDLAAGIGFPPLVPELCSGEARTPTPGIPREPVASSRRRVEVATGGPRRGSSGPLGDVWVGQRGAGLAGRAGLG